MDKVDIEHLVRKINKDKRIKALHNNFSELPVYQLNEAELTEEIQNLHTLRKTRILNRRSKSFINDIIDAMLDDGSKRARLVEITSVCYKTLHNLKNTLEDLEGYILYEYGSHMNGLRTKHEREQFVYHHVLRKFHKYLKKVERVYEAAKIVVEDIDKAGYNYRNLVEAVKLIKSKTSEI